MKPLSSTRRASNNRLQVRTPDQQNRISDHFTVNRGSEPTTPPSKRQKKNCSSIVDTPVASYVHTIDAEDMYTFTTSQPKGGVIDLTGSPPPSPAKATSSQNTNGHACPANFSPHRPRKMVVKNLRKTQKADQEQYFEKIWNQLDAAISAILNDNTACFSMEELYKGVENVCRQDKAPELFKRLSERCKDHMLKIIKLELLRAYKTKRGLLQATCDCWASWMKKMVNPMLQNTLKIDAKLTISGYHTFYLLLYGPLISSSFIIAPIHRGARHRSVPTSNSFGRGLGHSDFERCVFAFGTRSKQCFPSRQLDSFRRSSQHVPCLISLF